MSVPVLILALGLGHEVLKRQAQFRVRLALATGSSRLDLLKGMALTNEEVVLAEGVATAIANARRRNPGARVLNLTPDGFYACFEEYSYHPMFVQWNGVYDDLNPVVERYLEDEKPIVVGLLSTFVDPRYRVVEIWPDGVGLFEPIGSRGSRRKLSRRGGEDG